MNKEFDCLKMKEEIYNKIYTKTKKLSLNEYADYIKKNVKKTQMWQILEKVKQSKLNHTN